MGFDDIDRRFQPTPPRLTCLRCGTTDGVALEDARTQYPYDGPLSAPDDPNRPLPLCRPCAQWHHKYWDEMWAEYWSGRL